MSAQTRLRAALAGLVVLAACASSGADTVTVAPSNTTTAATTPSSTTTRPSTTTSSTTTTTPASTTTSLGQLSQPEPVPDAYAAEPEVILGHLEIPRLGLSTDLRQGITLTTLDKGPGHWPGTAAPGALGNMVIAGHRVTHSRPFRHLDDMVPGDEVIVTMADGTVFRYVTIGSEVVDDESLWITEQTYAYTGTLFACHPPGSARERYVVHLELVQ